MVSCCFLLLKSDVDPCRDLIGDACGDILGRGDARGEPFGECELSAGDGAYRGECAKTDANASIGPLAVAAVASIVMVRSGWA